MTDDLQILIDHRAHAKRREKVLLALRAYNDGQSSWHKEMRSKGGRPLDVYALDQNKQIIAGLVGETFWGWLSIDYLWVTEAHRHNGLGSLLLLEAETVAIARKCQWAKVTTFSFQAPTFYQNLGYQVSGQLDNYPPGHTLYWLKKTLPEATLPYSA
ncbi:MAG: GNAT superfamily N-acetyltransferase [Reinekea sp.]|jgi:GNAT superfamily N-acetyltransferase